MKIVLKLPTASAQRFTALKNRLETDDTGVLKDALRLLEAMLDCEPVYTKQADGSFKELKLFA